MVESLLSQGTGSSMSGLLLFDLFPQGLKPADFMEG